MEEKKEEVKPIEEINRVEGRSNKKLVLTLCIVGFILEIVTLIIIKAQVTTFSWNQLIWWSVGGLLVFGGTITGFYLFTMKDNRLTEDIKKKLLVQPEPISMDECRDFVTELMLNPIYAQYLSKPEEEYSTVEGDEVKSHIYVQVAYGKYLMEGRKAKFAILINMHFPKTLHAILINPKDYEIKERTRTLATKPKETPKYAESVTETPHLGVRTYHKAPIKEEHKLKEEEKKEDML